MTTKTISLTEDAYERLKALKREGESFSDVVNRVAGGDRDVWKGFGRYSGEDGVRLQDAIEEGREEMDRDMDERGEEVAASLEKTNEDR